MRRPLSRDLIVETAQAVVRAEGLDGVSMRRVAQELGTGPASLYAHVSDKDELLELVTDRIAGQIPLLEPDPDRWREQIRESARAARRVWQSYADICRVLLGRLPAGENQLRVAENHLAILRAGGVPDRIAAWFVDRLALFVTADVLVGTAFAAKARQGRDPAEDLRRLRGRFQNLPPDQFPNIVSMTDHLSDVDGDRRFEFGLELMIRGLASYVED